MIAADHQGPDDVAELGGVGEVGRVKRRDRVARDRVSVDGGAETQAAQDRQLVGGVATADVEAGVGLGVAQALGLGQGVGEGPAIAGHRREDEVRRAVDDAVELGDPIRGQALAQDPDDRHAAAHRGLVVDVHAVALGGGEHLGAMAGQEQLVGGDDVFARGDRRHHRVLGQAVAAHQLAHDVDVGPVDRGVDVGGEERGIDVDQALLADRLADRDRPHHQPAAQARADRRGVVLEELDHAGADVAQAQERDAELALAHGPAR
jgi:hypothetical protein